MLRNNNKKRILYISIVLLVTIGLSVGFSAFQKSLNIEDLLMHVRIQKETRITGITIQNASGAVSNSEDYAEDYNVRKVYGSVTFNNSSSYMLYKVSLTNYGNVKMGLLDINTTTSGINYQLCNSSGGSCTSDARTAICNGSNCTLGVSKDIYVKVSSTASGTKNLDLNFNFQPYNDITYDNVRENTNSFPTEIMSTDSFTITLTSKPEEVEVSGTGEVSYNKNTGVLTVSNVGSDLTIQAKYLATSIAETSYTGSDPDNYVSFNNSLYRIVTKENVDDGYNNIELRAKIIKHDSIGKNIYADAVEDEMTILFDNSRIKDTLNTTYYNSLSSEASELIDTFLYDNDYFDENLIVYFSLLDQDELGNDWIDNYEQYLSFYVLLYPRNSLHV